MKNEKEITIEYCIDKKKMCCITSIVVLLLVSSLYQAEIIVGGYAYIPFLLYVIFKCIIARGHWSKWHEKLHKEGFYFKNNNGDVIIHAGKIYTKCKDVISFIKCLKGLLIDKRCYTKRKSSISIKNYMMRLLAGKRYYTKCKDVPVNNYIIGLLAPLAMYMSLYLLWGGIMIVFRDNFNISIYLYYFLIFTILNPAVFGFTEFMFDIWVAGKLFLATMNNKKFNVRTPKHYRYGYILTPRLSTEENL
ncbi:hypothetical protein SELR_12500 [Selenomonas ruminantium subsp. lactilytica TAM6421]|uniref:Uncharacterized protein n=1 Tax=Selenomonas ruminantium subsp. lactilytica (strain NBRC 103574 / TAM6421) TaxID=927704 RepID=I0GQC1_SELRL|nr:hypothetical protein [Selenomonas ruminantium]BAL82958.1 hypothetical protein SELR_12500 [Selenomonas ruminantium subsp. lactilytica TAM6421]